VLVKAIVRDAVWLVFTKPKFKSAGTTSTVPFVTVTVALCDFVVSVAEAAVIVTVAGFGSVAGAVYVVAIPLNVLPGSTVPQVEHAAPFCVMVQFTPAFAGSLTNVEVNA
jgi:hypothetical protein